MFKRGLVFSGMFFLIFLASGCFHSVKDRIVSEPIVEDKDNAKIPIPFTLLYSSNRHATLTPCTCFRAPFGGLDREKNALDEIKAKKDRVFLSVDAGNLFAPYKPKKSAKEREFASLMVPLINEMELDVFAPGPSDYSLGGGFLEEISKRANFAFVSSNVFSKGTSSTLFSKFKIIEKSGVKIGVLSLTPPSEVVSADLSVADPGLALATLLPVVRAQADLIVVLSQLNIADNEILAAKHPKIVIVGADANISIESPFWYPSQSLIVEPHNEGVYLGRLDLDLILPLQGFNSLVEVTKNQDEIKQYEERLKKDPNDRLAKIRINVLKNKSMLALIPQGSFYSNSLVELDQGRFGKRNEISAIIDDLTGQKTNVSH